MTNVVAIEYEGTTTEVKQTFLNRMRHSRFARPRETGKPQNYAPMAIPAFAISAPDLGVMPADIFILGIQVVGKLPSKLVIVSVSGKVSPRCHTSYQFQFSY